MKPQPLWLLPTSLALSLCGCAALPRDQHGATTRIRQSKVLTVGVSPADAQHTPMEKREKQLVETIAHRLGARVVWRTGNAHKLLQDLEELKLPLVAATISCDSPFGARLGMSQPYLKNGPHHRDYCLAVAPGENSLLLLVDQVIAEERAREER